MASVFGYRSYHNKPEKTNLYKNIQELIMATHQSTKDDKAVLQDILQELGDFD